VISNPSRSGYSSLRERQVAETGHVLTESNLAALEKKRDGDVVYGEIETAHLGYMCSQDTFYVGIIKGVRRICQQTFVDTYLAKLYKTKSISVGISGKGSPSCG
jgi:hypothetical protein